MQRTISYRNYCHIKYLKGFHLKSTRIYIQSRQMYKQEITKEYLKAALAIR